MAKRLNQKQIESTLYMPSMYDTGDEDEEGTDQRDERSPNERNQNLLRSPRFALQRCLAWSQDEDLNEERVPGEVHDDYDVENENGAHLRLLPQYSESSIGMVKSFGSFQSAVVDAASSIDLHVNTITNNGIRPVHWEEQVTVDKNLDSFLFSKKAVTG
ncbi:hypothetical protein IV203_029641 [Nitzschia inconspicua]|uniref:Uncharacterized protein n=1 Tax=Nitzschia inconspicua TaxID=303405 RepID=A0A9K3Q167_9STRA|nr:hypothetical protein IV203_029641 [Nitzschia inconspicua]